METWDTDFQIFLGDWNLVQDQDNDTHGYLHVNNINAKNTVLDAKDNFDLVDPWRIKNATKKFTWFKKSNNTIVKCARLDFFFISNSLSPYVVDTCILPGVFSDHSIIKIDLDFSKVQMGPGYFKFNNSLLKNLNYLEHIKKLILRTTELYSTDDLGEEYWQNIQPQHIQNINLNINAQLFFDVLLMEIRGFSVEYCSRLKKEKNDQFNSLTKEYNNIDSLLNLDLDNTDLQQRHDSVKTNIEEHLKYQAEGAAVRAKAVHSLDGERATSYFCSLEKHNFTKKYISILRKDDDILTNQAEIEKEVYTYYKHLYSKDNNVTDDTIENYIGPRHTDIPKLTDQGDIEKEVYTYYKHLYTSDEDVEDDTIENYIGPGHTDIPKLNDNLKSKCEGEITMTELINYLKQLRNNKSPGISGFTGEFYKFFL